MRFTNAAAILVTILLGGDVAGQDRTLFWKSLDVTARLEADASLHVTERHTMVFDGAWNGGERSFRIEPGQSVTLLHLRRVSDGGVEELKLGNLARTGAYAMNGDVLRWRTRQPDDPPYRNEVLTFEIDYVLSGIVRRSGEAYRIDHDFAFPDRPGPIERFTLQYEHDPVWQADPVAPLEKADLPVGESVVLHQQLLFTGQGEPAQIYRRPPLPPPPPPPPPPWRLSSAARLAGGGALVAIFAAIVAIFFRHERQVGRFEKWDELLPEGEGWLQNNIFAYAPEVIGAAWDETSSEPEVAALLARLIQEGKIRSVPKEINKTYSMMQLELTVPRTELEEHEKTLVDALFVSGNVTDRAKIRTRYRAAGFDPAARLRPPMMRKVESVTTRAFGPVTTVSFNVGVLLMVSVVFALVAGIFTSGGVAAFAVFAGVCFSIGLLLARRYRWRILGARDAVLVVLPLAAMLGSALLVTHPVGFTIAATLTILLTWYVLRKAQWHGTRELLQWRRNLVAARDWFAFELSKPEPRLKDEWTPWLIGFGLSSAMDTWAKSFSAPRPPAAPPSNLSGVDSQ
ncbi:MAG TPA: DUF2207 domain-containing protein, partial [Thermoanaerobaculia bacterium]|nr:DUF2207 domain-containing protein [Thermoanaerobaculia bacterium]